MDRKLTIISCVLWIAGITATIVGLNIEGDTGTWLTVCGNIGFLVGLGLQGVLWLRKQREAKKENPAGPAEPAGRDQNQE